MSKQDRQPVRNVTGLEYKYGLGDTVNALRGLQDTAAHLAEREKMLEAELSLRIRYDDNGKIVSMLNASADIIRLRSNRLEIESDHFSLSTDGTVRATAGVIGGCEIVDGVLKVKAANIDGKLTADNIDTGSFTAKLDTIEERVKETETSLTVVSGQIASKVSQTDFDTLGNRVGTAESNISQLPNQILSTVSGTYATQQGLSQANSRIDQQAQAIALKVSQTDFDTLGKTVNTISGELALKIGKNDSGQIVSMLNAAADVIDIKSNRLKITSDNFSLSADGTVNARAGVIGGCTIENGALKIPAANITGTLTASQINGDRLNVSGGVFDDCTIKESCKVKGVLQSESGEIGWWVVGFDENFNFPILRAKYGFGAKVLWGDGTANETDGWCFLALTWRGIYYIIKKFADYTSQTLQVIPEYKIDGFSNIKYPNIEEEI